MAIIPQYSPVTTGLDGDAVFTFPDVPAGEVWCGTVTIPEAPNEASGIVMTGGLVVGAIAGAGVFGPFVGDSTRILSIAAEGLYPATQYQAVWHIDNRGLAAATFPEVINVAVPPIIWATIGNPVLAPNGATTNIFGALPGPFYIKSWGVTDLHSTAPHPSLLATASSGQAPFDVLAVSNFEQWSDRPGGQRVPGLYVVNSTGVDLHVGAVYSQVFNPVDQ